MTATTTQKTETTVTYYRGVTVADMNPGKDEKVKSSWGGPIKAGTKVYFRVSEACRFDYGNGNFLELPKRVIVLAHGGYRGNRLQVSFDEAKNYIRSERVAGKIQVDDKGVGAKIDGDIDWELSR